MKMTCSACGEYKEPDRIYTQSYCNACHAEWKRLNTKKETFVHPVEKKKRVARAKARHAFSKGLIQRKPCEECGYEVTQFHHPDYDKPLQVQNLCALCHADLHRRERLGIGKTTQMSTEGNINKVA